MAKLNVKITYCSKSKTNYAQFASLFDEVGYNNSLVYEYKYLYEKV